MVPPANHSLQYVLGILNSSVIDFYFKLIAQTSGMGVTRWINLYVEKFPIPSPAADKKQAIERLVERILVAKARDSSVNTSPQEKQIDQLVCELYGLTPEEIQIVEESSRR
jgi:hypothetical protein